jgi:hypothetical protein
MKGLCRRPLPFDFTGNVRQLMQFDLLKNENLSRFNSKQAQALISVAHVELIFFKR